MKKFYLLFVAVILAACSAEPVENEVLSGLDANLEGKNNKATVQDVGEEEFIIPDQICAGEDANFEIHAPIGTNIQVQQLIGDDWIQVDQISKSISNPHITTLNFEIAGEYQLRYKAGSGGFGKEVFTVTAVNCVTEPNCQTGYLQGNTPLKELDNSANWGWAHLFDIREDGTKKTFQLYSGAAQNDIEKGEMIGEIEVEWNEDGTVELNHSSNVHIKHMYISDVKPTDGAPGQFGKTGNLGDDNEDGIFWFIIRAESCK